MNYTGEKCVKCGREFTEDDDVVVCPECGSPHHRECYFEDNMCANSELHGSGFVWKKTKTDDKAAEDIEIYVDSEAEEETFTNDSGSSEAGQDFGISRPYLGFDPNEDMGGATLKEVSEFVKTNTIYYIPIFKRMKDIGSKMSFNLICFLFPPLYFANRRMWFWAIFTTAATVLFALPSTIGNFLDDCIENGRFLFSPEITNFLYNNQHILSAAIDICNMFNMLMKVLMCLFGNWLYFRFSMKSLIKLKNRYKNQPLTRDVISLFGGSKPINMLLILLIMAAMMMITLYAGIFVMQFISIMFM